MTLEGGGFSGSEGRSNEPSDGSTNHRTPQPGWENAKTAATEQTGTSEPQVPKPHSSHQPEDAYDQRSENVSSASSLGGRPPSSFEYSDSKRRALEQQTQHRIPKRQLYLFAGVGIFLLAGVAIFLLASDKQNDETDVEATQATTTSLVTLEIAGSPAAAANPTDSPVTTADTASAETTSTEAAEATTPASPAKSVPVLGVLGDNKVSVAGEVPSEQIAVALVQLLKPLAGEGQVASQLTISSEAAPVKHLSISLADEVLFGAGSDSISPEFYPLLDQVVALMLASPSITVVVEGHTDSSGDEVENLSLSQRRAEAVVAYIADNGINRFRLEPRGRGSGEPIAENNTQDGRQRNRRIEFDIAGFDLGLSS